MVFRPDSPEELPDGRLVCGSHGLVICPICTVDYSFMEEFISDNEEDHDDDDFANSDLELDYNGDDEQPNLDFDLRVGSGRIIPKKFTPPNRTDKPQTLFPASAETRPRFTRRTDAKQFLIYTDGACLDNGGPNPRAGWAFLINHRTKGVGKGYAGRPLEKRGPTGEAHAPTSNRAELRAVIAASRYRFWGGGQEGYKSLVIATDSEYVVEGVTGWVRGWIRNGWKTRGGEDVRNRDLWECLLGEVERWHDQGMEVLFWRIGREDNVEADCHAKQAAEQGPGNDEFMDLMGLFA